MNFEVIHFLDMFSTERTENTLPTTIKVIFAFGARFQIHDALTKIIHVIIFVKEFRGWREIFWSDKVFRNIIGFSNRAQRFTGSNYLGVDSPLKKLRLGPIYYSDFLIQNKF